MNAGHTQRRSPTYRGKELDALGAVLTMALLATGRRRPPHVQCMTARPFACRAPLHDPRRWLAPWVAPSRALRIGLENLGVPFRARAVGSEGSAEALLDLARAWLSEGPVVLGPLDRVRMWDRVEGRFHSGGCHFVLLIEEVSGDRLVVHDPEGCPHLKVSQTRLEAALDASEGGLVQLLPGAEASVAPEEDALVRAMVRGIQVRAEAGGCANAAARGLRSLAARLVTGLSASERAALPFALPGYSLARHRVAALVMDVPPSRVRDPRSWLEARADVVDCADRCGRLTAEMLEACQSGAVDGLSAPLEAIADLEDELDTLLPASALSIGDGPLFAVPHARLVST